MKAIDAFERAGIEILSPAKSKIVNPGAKFVVFDSDNAELGIKGLEKKHLKAIKDSDFLYIFNPPYKGKPYIGNSAVMEIGFAIAHSKPIYCLEPIDDQTLDAFVVGRFNPEILTEAKKSLSKLNLEKINKIAQSGSSTL